MFKIMLLGLTAITISACNATKQKKSKQINLGAVQSKKEMSKSCKWQKSYAELTTSNLVDEINKCVNAKKHKTAKTQILELFRRPGSAGLGHYYYSLINEAQGNKEKSRWHIDKALAESPDEALYTYQNLRLSQGLNIAEKRSVLENVISRKPNLIDARVWLAKDAYAQEKHSLVVSYLDKYTNNVPRTLIKILLKSHIELGNLDRAGFIVERFSIEKRFPKFYKQIEPMLTRSQKLGNLAIVQEVN
ncbi:MAG: tetratricopeptide repeat protein [Bdellovibrionales bacterium]